MNTDRSSEPPARSWVERFTLALSGAEPKDRTQLVELLRSAHQRQIIDPDALGMIEGVMQVSEMQVRDIMIPRAQMDMVRRDAALDDIVTILADSAHSRFPVIGDDRDEVVGILLAKDMLRYFVKDGQEVFDMQDILRPAVFVPESKRLNVLLKEFRNSRNHMAIVVDEYGGVAGLVTIEDVLEQIVGEIDDEHDIEDFLTHILRHANGRFTVKALTPIEEFNAYFNTDYSDDEFDTIGGFVIHRFGHVPKRGEELSFDRFHVRVLRADNRRVHLLELSYRETPTAEAAEPTSL
ncbi:HlyC/CorC family transporter [Ectothiorhodospira lacustris]|uniref:HlyC/CorC family transporter n=1 Tax=Ectothiorhodospira lacustris TaxID=2899127 RepID=UPI001EE87F38|nr:transporter associated domain-containing protein [Ectothiorhodospira lacustris]MCG5508963.1 CBS domain-containing protein [Ectothiorhodospira lacustris]MCG5520754.1 CBS domain-containing protein [Ectothiorhodospira lacustris]